MGDEKWKTMTEEEQHIWREKAQDWGEKENTGISTVENIVNDILEMHISPVGPKRKVGEDNAGVEDKS